MTLYSKHCYVFFIHVFISTYSTRWLWLTNYFLNIISPDLRVEMIKKKPSTEKLKKFQHPLNCWYSIYNHKICWVDSVFILWSIIIIFNENKTKIYLIFILLIVIGFVKRVSFIQKKFNLIIIHIIIILNIFVQV